MTPEAEERGRGQKTEVERLTHERDEARAEANWFKAACNGWKHGEDERQQEVVAFRATLAQRDEQVNKLREELLRLEWSAYDELSSCSCGAQCPRCDGYVSLCEGHTARGEYTRGHEADCPLGAILAATARHTGI